MLKYYMAELFEPTLLYSFALSFLGVSLAYYYGRFSMEYAVLAILGSILAQMSVNVISDYFDYKSGLDRELAKKKAGNLSGGSSLIAERKIKPGYTLLMGIVAFVLAGIIGIFFLTIRIQLLPILAIAAFSILLYARLVKRIPYMSEPLCTLNYTLIAFGSFIAVAGFSAVSIKLAFAFIPAGIMLGGNALFINEIPDSAIDRKYKVRHSAVMLGTSRHIAIYYLSFQVAAYAILVIGIVTGMLPLFAVASLIAIPATPYIFNGIYKAHISKYRDYLGMQTISSFIFAMLLSAAYVFTVM